MPKSTKAELAAAEKYRKKCFTKLLRLPRSGNEEIIAEIEKIPRGKFSAIAAQALAEYFAKNN